jgi:chitosanase
MIRDRTTKECGSVTTAGEKKWIAAYIGQRLDWLTNHKLDVLRATTYRMDTLKALVDAGKWGLELPLVIRGREVSMATLGGKPGGCYDGPVAGSRALAVQAPLARGADVRKVQLVLSLDGIEVVADGIYGSATAQLIKNQQKAAKLPETGVADPSLIAALLARKNLPA